MILNPNIDLETHRCSACHRYYAHERAQWCRCPHCAETRIDKLVDEACELETRVSRLKGVITRMKRKAAKGGRP